MKGPRKPRDPHVRGAEGYGMPQVFYGPCEPSWTLGAAAAALPVAKACRSRVRFPHLHHAQGKARQLLRDHAVCMRVEVCRCGGYHLARLLPHHGKELPPPSL